MATFNTDRIRKGLPRSPGGPAWPDVANAALAEETVVVAAPAAEPVADAVAEPAVAVASPVAAAEAPEMAAPAADVAAAAPDAVPSVPSVAGVEVPLRRGLPRTAGGDPWPPAGVATVSAAAPKAAAARHAAPAVDATADAEQVVDSVAAATVAPAEVPGAAAPQPAAESAAAPATALATETEEVTLRRGLPRTAGGDPWPPAATVKVERAVALAAVAATAVEAAAAETAAVPVAAPEQPQPAMAAVQAEQAAAPIPEAVSNAPQPAPAPQPQPAPQPAPEPAQAPTKPREPIMVGGITLGKLIKRVVLWGGGAILAAAIIVLAARGVTTLPGVPEFMKRYPGEYHLPDFVDPGFPAWARWSHYLNFFLMVLIIRSGLLVRQQQKPDAFFTPKKGGKKVSIYLWLHTSLDLLWLANGVIFVVLLFVSGHWARIVPTSWEVFPNAASAALQYLTLEWPVENGWVNYNSLQQIMYFTVVFIAAPLAAITGVRMSEWWPKDAEKLNKAYPAPLARAIHFPVMLFFVLFILVHVFLVFTTGALKNLNHMFVGTPEPSWFGFWMFALGLLVTAAVTFAARPLVLAPIAGVFGRVSER